MTRPRMDRSFEKDPNFDLRIDDRLTIGQCSKKDRVFLHWKDMDRMRIDQRSTKDRIFFPLKAYVNKFRLNQIGKDRCTIESDRSNLGPDQPDLNVPDPDDLSPADPWPVRSRSFQRSGICGALMPTSVSILISTTLYTFMSLTPFSQPWHIAERKCMHTVQDTERPLWGASYDSECGENL